MRSSSTDARSRRRTARGTWARLAATAVLVLLLLLSSALERTGALLTDTVRTSTVVSTALVFPSSTPAPAG